jgi:hypothetical protein
MYPNKIHLYVHKNLVTGYVNVTGPKSSPVAKHAEENEGL